MKLGVFLTLNVSGSKSFEFLISTTASWCSCTAMGLKCSMEGDKSSDREVALPERGTWTV